MCGTTSTLPSRSRRRGLRIERVARVLRPHRDVVRRAVEQVAAPVVVAVDEEDRRRAADQPEVGPLQRVAPGHLRRVDRRRSEVSTLKSSPWRCRSRWSAAAASSVRRTGRRRTACSCARVRVALDAKVKLLPGGRACGSALRRVEADTRRRRCGSQPVEVVGVRPQPVEQQLRRPAGDQGNAAVCCAYTPGAVPYLTETSPAWSGAYTLTRTDAAVGLPSTTSPRNNPSRRRPSHSAPAQPVAGEDGPVGPLPPPQAAAARGEGERGQASERVHLMRSPLGEASCASASLRRAQGSKTGSRCWPMLRGHTLTSLITPE